MTLSTSEQLHNFVDDLERTLDTDVPEVPRCRNVILCGMGGSAITSDIVADCCFCSSPLPITVQKSPLLPNWVGKGTLAVISSYSGNTAETIEMYERARDRGCTVVAITSGGKLLELARRDGRIAMTLPEGLHPRHAIGYMIGYTLRIMNSAGCPDISDEIRSILPSLRDYRDALEREDSMAHRLASEILDHVPFVLAESRLKSVVLRWKTQFNENSKYVAFCSSVPEFRYCGLESWTLVSQENFKPILLEGCEASRGCVGRSVAAVKQALKDSGKEFTDIVLGGANEMEDMFRAIMLGDYTSIFMAELRGIDSAEVKPVMLMKERLKTRPPE